jgi:hypothetical protein
MGVYMRFASLSAWIRRQHWGVQLALFPLLAMAWLAYNLVLLPIGWIAKEAGGQAKAGAKKVLAPLLWPLLAIVGVVLIVAALGVQGVDQLLNALVVPAVYILGLLGMLYGLRVMVSGVWPMGGSKKPRHKR